MAEREPWLWIIAGPNGAGKTTFATQTLHDDFHIRHFVNTDEMARFLSPDQPDNALVRSGRMMLDAFDQLRQNRQSFAIETTLSGRLYFRRAETMRQEGWKCGMIYVWLNSPSLAIERVAHRVAKGGHHVSHDDIRRRYARSQDNLIKYIEICDKVFVFDNSGNEPVYVGHGGNGVFVSDADHKLGQFIDIKLALET